MHKQELPELSSRLSQLADALGGKAPSPAGLLVWGDALAECRTDDVKAVLTDWPKSHTKMPSPAEILKSCRELAAARREAAEAIERAKGGGGLEKVFANANTEVARAALKGILEMLADCKPGLVAGTFHPISGRPDADHKAWAKKLKARHEAGESLSPQQIQMYRSAL